MKITGLKRIDSGFLRNIHLIVRHIKFFVRHVSFLKFYNLCLNYYEKFTNKSVLKSFPFEIIIDPINICQLQCPLCPTGQRVNTRKKGRMDFNIYKNLVDELGSRLFKIRLYSWGEPLMHANIFNMIAYASEKNISTEISTHLNYFKESYASRLIDSGLEMLIISMDGADAETYSTYRKKGDFEKACRNLKAISNAKKERGGKYPIIELQFLVMKHNESQIEQIVELAKEMGVDSIRFGPVTVNIKNKSDKKWLPEKENLSRYYYDLNVDRIYSSRKKCEWLWRSAVINWDQAVSPCCVYEGTKSDFGNIREKSFSDIWNNTNYVQAREVFTRRKKENTSGNKNNICCFCQGIPKALDKNQHGLY